MEENQERQDLKYRKAKKSIVFSFWPFVGIAMIFTVIGALGLHNWIPDLASQFFVQYFVVQIAFCILLLWFRERKSALVMLPFILICLIKIVPTYIPDSSAIKVDSSSSKIKLLQINVNSRNNKYNAALNYVNKLEPDIVLFEEVTSQWLKNLSSGLNEKYSLIESSAREDNFGIALFSKIPKVDSKIIPLGYKAIPAIDSVFEVDGKKFTVFCAHVLPPLTGAYFRERNLHYDEIALYRKKASARFVLLGDLNTTNWSPFFQDLLKKANLKDSSKGYGVRPTWPVQMFFLGIPIDHCLYSNDFSVIQRQLGSHLGSDHLPVYVELAIVK